MNDSTEKKAKPKESEFSFFNLISYGMLCSIGITTLVFSPLPMILAHLRLEDPWRKVAALLGAVIALVLLEVPVIPVLFAFSFGIFVADRVGTEKSPWRLMSTSLLFAAGLGGFIYFVMAQMEGVALGEFWVGLVDRTMEQIKNSVRSEQALDWEVIRGLLLYEGPFLYLSGVLLSLWLSVGLAAHFEWFETGHAFSGEMLRNLRLPKWASFVFVGAFLGLTLAKWDPGIPGGLFRIAGVLMFIQGCAFLSQALNVRQFAPRVRTLIYSLAIFLGFYAVVGMGVMGPWLFKRGPSSRSTYRQKLEEGI